MPEPYDPVAIAGDLVDCRQRGLDWLDHKSTNQQPVNAAGLQGLAEDYVAARGLVAIGRIAQIKILLEHGIAELSRQGQPADASLLRDLFFGGSPDGAIKPPGELLRNARKRSGETEARFRERRSNAMKTFAGFLITFTILATHDVPRASDGDEPDTRQQLATTGFVGDNEHFVQMLAAASKATIVGITNERLLPMLTEALRRKRSGGRTEAFWDSLRIVFLAEALLGAVNDEREQLDDPRRALRKRCQEAFWARRFIGVFLKRTHSSRWSLFESRYMPELTGSLLEFSDRKVVHLLMRRPRRPTADHLYIDLEDRTDHFSAVFEDIVHNSASDNMIVPVGVPTGETFHCGDIRLHSSVLKDGSGESGWLPMILIITYRRRDDQVEAVLQLRTVENSAREENRLSHIGTHLLEADRLRAAGTESAGLPRTLGRTDEIPRTAAERLVENVTGIDPDEALRPMATGRYLYPDKEHLFFFVYSIELPEGVQLPRRAEMHSFALSELLAVRGEQVLRSAADLCLIPQVSERTWAAAAEILALNLTLHDHGDVGRELERLAGRPAGDRASVAAEISQLVPGRTTPSWASANREVPLLGLAGWQYREFFSVLVPLYATIGIHGAAELLGQIDADEMKRDARDRLARLYQDEHLMALMPLEL